MYLTKSYVIVNIQKGNPSYGRLTIGNIDMEKHPIGYGPDWRKANDIEAELYWSNTEIRTIFPKNVVLALKHI